MKIDPVIAKSLKEMSKSPGVYLFRDGRGDVIYVGKAKNLRNRVRNYFNPRAVAMDNRLKIKAMIAHIRRIETVEVKSEAEALILESRLLKEYKPKYNTDFVDDKRFYLIRVSGGRYSAQEFAPGKEYCNPGLLGASATHQGVVGADVASDPASAGSWDGLPRFTLCRNRIDSASVYYGPFVNGTAVKKLITELRRRYGVLLSDGNPQKLSEDQWRLYDDARGQMFEHANVVTRAEYMQRVVKASAFLEGQTRVWREEVYQKMTEAAEARRFEEAAKWRDLLGALTAVRNPGKKFLRDPLINLLDGQKAMNELKEALRMEELPTSIECFDISHISGSFVVASLVRFDNGKANKKQYKVFKVRGDAPRAEDRGYNHSVPASGTKSTSRNIYEGVNDDFAAMREVVGRRYRRQIEENKELPKLIVIDGGVGQLKSALAAFLENGITPPMMIGLAKREETFVFSDGRAPLTLPRDNMGLRLLQRVRDEAHRVANGFNAKWRSRQMKTSILDEIKGLGPIKKNKLLEKFPSMESLKRAGLEKIAEVVGEKLAEAIVSRTRG